MVERGGLENHCRQCLPGVRIPPPPLSSEMWVYPIKHKATSEGLSSERVRLFPNLNLTIDGDPMRDN